MKKKTTKRIWGILLALCMLLALVPMGAFAEEALYKEFDTCGIYYRIENGEAIVVGAVAADVVIPDTLDGCPVTTIAAEAFLWNDYVVNLSIPASVTKIGENALSITEALRKITVAADNPNFCTDSTGVLYTKDMTKLIRCPSFEGAYTVPDGVTEIGDRAFGTTQSLSKITVAADNPSFCTDSTGVLYTKDMTKLIKAPCTSISGSYTVPEGVTEIGTEAFGGCYELTSIILPDSLTMINKFAFTNCHSLESINIPECVTSIDEYTFEKCVSLTEIDIPGSVTYIGIEAFSECENLSNVKLGNGLNIIDESAFKKCRSLTGITLPDSLTTIGSYAFDDCTGLASVNIPPCVKIIGDWAFSNCPLSSVTIPDSVTEVGNAAFAFNDSLKSVVIGRGLASDYAFISHCPNLTSVTIKDGASFISEGMFSSCTGLTSITIPASVTKIGNHAFNACTNLSSVYFLGNAPVLDNTMEIDERGSRDKIGECMFKTYVEGASEDYYDCFVNLPNLTIYYPEGASGWTSPTWHGYPTAVIGTVQPSTPSTPQQPVEPTAPMVGSFTDVRTDDWFAGAVEYAVANGLFSGVSETSFAPNDRVTRAMLVTVLWRAAGEPPRSSDVSFFDINPFDWYGEAVRWAASEGIVGGYGDGYFGTNDPVTREQLAAIFQRYATFKGMATTERGDLSQFADVGAISGWANDNVAWAVGAGLISGKGGGMLDPQGGATRAEVAVILQRFLEK